MLTKANPKTAATTASKVALITGITEQDTCAGTVAPHLALARQHALRKAPGYRIKVSAA